MTGFTTPLDTSDNALERVGGKGRALALLATPGSQSPTGSTSRQTPIASSWTKRLAATHS